MDLYTKTSYSLSKSLTKAYSTSFSLSMTLFSPEIRRHVYAIYGLVRIADEIVDTYIGTDKRTKLNTLEKEVTEAIKKQYSANPIIHSFAITAALFDINTDHIAAFFKSMRMDLEKLTYTQHLYNEYIYGSAEVVGLMCLKVFTADQALYKKLEKGASRLGAAYQKVNFIRDIRADAEGLGRWYFPFGSFETFDEVTKERIIKDIREDFIAARRATLGLPLSSRRAVMLSILYYESLLDKITKTPASTLKTKRIRVSNVEKLKLLLKVRTTHYEA